MQAADVAADPAMGHAGLLIDLEEACAAIGGAVKTRRGIRCDGAAPHGGRSSSDGQGSGGTSGSLYCFLARHDRGIGDRLRGRGCRLGTSAFERPFSGVCAPGRERDLCARTGSSRRTVTRTVSATRAIASNAQDAGSAQPRLPNASCHRCAMISLLFIKGWLNLDRPAVTLAADGACRTRAPIGGPQMRRHQIDDFWR